MTPTYIIVMLTLGLYKPLSEFHLEVVIFMGLKLSLNTTFTPILKIGLRMELLSSTSQKMSHFVKMLYHFVIIQKHFLGQTLTAGDIY